MQPDFEALYAFYETRKPQRAKKKAKRRAAKKKAVRAKVPPPAPRRRRQRAEEISREEISRAPAARRSPRHAKKGWIAAPIVIEIDEGPVEVMAQVLGPEGVFAVHQVPEHRGLYQLTHVPTGAAMPGAQAGARSLAKLKKAAAALGNVTDWTSSKIVREYKRSQEEGQLSAFLRKLREASVPVISKSLA